MNCKLNSVNSFKNVLFVFLFFAFLSLPISCMGKTDEQIQKLVFSAIETKDFSALLSPKDKLLSELARLDDGCLFFTGVHLLDNGYTKDAVKYFKYGSVKYKDSSFKLLCENALYEIADKDVYASDFAEALNKEKIAILSNRLQNAKKDSDEKAVKEITRKLNIILFKQGKYSKLTQDVPLIFAETKMDVNLAKAFNSFSEKADTLTKSLPKSFFDMTNARILFYKKNYSVAWLSAKAILESEDIANLSRPILSDFGKAAIYGTTNFADAAHIFETLFLNAEKLGGTDADLLFVLSFYTARLYTKAGNSFYDLAVHYFKKAEECAPNTYDYDNALWYRLDTIRLTSFKDYFAEIKRTTPLWKNSYWYEDLVDRLIVDFTTQKDVMSLQELKNAIDVTKLVEAKARLSYILARMGKKDDLVKNFESAFENDHNSLYYRAMASHFLKKSISGKGYSVRIERKTNPNFSKNDAVKILQGFVKYKLYSHIYKQVRVLHPGISSDEAIGFAQALNDAELYASSMSCMQFAMRSESGKISDEHLKLAYPRPWLSSVQKYAKEYDVPEYVIFALIRCESFFKPSVVSHAGAIGLSQLMKPTAKDIARRLNVTNYDLNDPDTNIRFGTYYLADMIRRHDGKIMQALFAYNAGPGNVRKWKRNFGNVPDDLFLERLPFAETRGYGRRVLAATVIYAHLYYGKTSSEVVKEIYPDFTD